jgi:hypothetical protein
MRFVFGLILVAGLAMIAYPHVAGGLAAEPLGTWRVYEAETGFAAAKPQLKADDAPVAVSVELTTRGASALPKGGAVLTVTAAVDGRTVFAKALDFAGAKGRDTNPQTQERMFRTEAAVIDPVEPGTYAFTFGSGDAEGVQMRAVDLVLARKGKAFDPRLQPVGFSLVAVGFIGLILAFRHRAGGPPSNPNSQPPSPRWGRGAG